MPKSLKITAICPEDATKILASAYGRRVTVEQVREADFAARAVGNACGMAGRTVDSSIGSR